VFLLVASSTFAASAPTWGTDGHQITGSVAQSLLTSATQSRVSSILAGQTLSQVSTWADSVKSSPAYLWSAVLHYIDTPDWACNYQYSRDCPSAQCVSGALKNYTKRLVDSSLPATQINEALKFVTHFAGDIHQPLHVGFTSDAGGNGITGTFEGAKDNLHYIWDTPLVRLRIKDFSGVQSKYVSYLLQQIQGIVPAFFLGTHSCSLALLYDWCRLVCLPLRVLSTGPWAANATQWAKCSTGGAVCPDDWASESIVLACTHSYVDENGDKIKNGFNLGDPYYQFNKDVIDEQLAKAGVRLASMLNSLLGQSSRARARAALVQHHRQLMQRGEQSQRYFKEYLSQLDDALPQN
jgi:hypothetical protein